MVDSASGETVDAAVYARAALAPGARLTGPAAVVEPGTTTIVPIGTTLHVAAGGELIIEVASP